DGVVEGDGADLLAGGVADVDGGHRHTFPFWVAAALPRTASRIRISPPRGPGTAPLSRMIWRSASAWTTSMFSVVTCWWPMRPAIRVPLNTRAGVAQAPMAPGERCFLWVPWPAPRPLKLWRFITP